MSAAQVAPQAPLLIATIMCRVLRFLRNIVLRYAKKIVVQTFSVLLSHYHRITIALPSHYHRTQMLV